MTMGAGIAIAGMWIAVAIVGWHDIPAGVMLGFFAFGLTAGALDG